MTPLETQASRQAHLRALPAQAKLFELFRQQRGPEAWLSHTRSGVIILWSLMKSSYKIHVLLDYQKY